jgi:hypothetical protein
LQAVIAQSTRQIFSTPDRELLDDADGDETKTAAAAAAASAVAAIATTKGLLIFISQGF